MGSQDAPETARPGSEMELADVLAEATRRGFKVVPRGGGTKSDWGGSPERADVVLSTLRLNRVLEHAAGDMTATVQAGCSISALQEVLAGSGQRLALDPLWPARATVGGVLATNDSGSLRAAFGSLRDLVLGITVALPDGTLARSGGKVVKNVAGYDLPKLMTGSMGTIGVITQATFRLHPLPRATQTYAFVAPTPAAANQFVLAVHDSTLAGTGLQVVAVKEPPCRIHLRVEGSESGIVASASLVAAMAAACGISEAVVSDDPWTERERLWERPGSVAKLTFLPTRLSDLCAAMPRGDWTLVAQGAGAALLHISTGVDELVEVAGCAVALGGSLLVLRGPVELKRRMNSLEKHGALSLMHSIKQKFDPSGTLNPGLWGGGI